MQRHIECFPSCPFLAGQMIGVSLVSPHFDESHPSAQLLKKTDEVVKKVRT